jgi:uncharacterized protein with GYD domain
MPLYMTQFKYTSDAWLALTRAPTDRSVPLGKLMESMGARLLSMHYCFGEYDGMILSEAPDAIITGAAIMAAFSAGHMSGIKTTPMFTNAEGMQMMDLAGKASFRPPTS